MLATPARAVVVHDEAVNGDLSSNPAAPTPLAFVADTSTLIGTMGSIGGQTDRDFITFTIEPKRILSALYLRVFSPINLAFAAFNAGSTSWLPSLSTTGNFLAGCHINDGDLLGYDILERMTWASDTEHSLPEPALPPGTYCFMVQQTSGIVQSYQFDFIVTNGVPALGQSWGAIKDLYR